MRPSMLLVAGMAISLLTSEFLSLGQANYDSRHDDGTRSRFLSQYGEKGTGCSSYNPYACRLRGSPGPACCRNSCVNVLTDRQNCGRCGYRCRYPQACCGGKCVDLFHDHMHCGRCFNKCKKGDICSYGMCNYAC